MNLPRTLERILRFALGGVFAFAGAVKAIDFEQLQFAAKTFDLAQLAQGLNAQQFALDVKNFQLLGWIDGLSWAPDGVTAWSVAILIAVYVPWLELIVGWMLLWRKCYAGALLLAAGFSVVFLAAIVSAWARGLDITCGCFGSSANATDYPRHLALNVLMLAGVAGLAWLQRARAAGLRRA